MPNAKIVWSEQAKLDLKGIRRRIGRNAPRTARKFVQKLKKSVALLENFPELGGHFSDLQTSGYRELIKGNYRII
jgi:addiction module RelE/StbE family toxin